MDTPYPVGTVITHRVSGGRFRVVSLLRGSDGAVHHKIEDAKTGDSFGWMLGAAIAANYAVVTSSVDVSGEQEPKRRRGRKPKVAKDPEVTAAPRESPSPPAVEAQESSPVMDDDDGEPGELLQLADEALEILGSIRPYVARLREIVDRLRREGL